MLGADAHWHIEPEWRKDLENAATLAVELEALRALVLKRK